MNIQNSRCRFYYFMTILALKKWMEGHVSATTFSEKEDFPELEINKLFYSLVQENDTDIRKTIALQLIDDCCNEENGRTIKNEMHKRFLRIIETEDIPFRIHVTKKPEDTQKWTDCFLAKGYKIEVTKEQCKYNHMHTIIYIIGSNGYRIEGTIVCPYCSDKHT
ncbi:hypothetical protein [Bacteroides sp.]